MVKLLDGRLLELKPRKKKHVVLDSDFGSIVDMDLLYEKVEQRRQWKESRALLQAAVQRDRANEAEGSNKENRPDETNRPEEMNRPNKEGGPSQERTNSGPADGQSRLWVDKYRPRSFLQLCPAGNEKLYRAVMHWLRKWGPMVFGDVPADAKPTHGGLGPADFSDPWHRPYKRILLVHGPPGIGKTALVHLVAHQMGYAVLELNAANSMDTMPGTAGDSQARHVGAHAALRLRVKTSLTTTSLTGKGRPTCLVVDEIDSAANCADIVRVLAELVHADSRRKVDSDQKSAKDKSKKEALLSRPIICIANDIWAQSLRSFGANPMEKLRLLCEIVALRKPSFDGAGGAKINASATSSVKEHLLRISDSERLGLDKADVTRVLQVCDYDLRACINHLQFASRKIHAFDNAAPETGATMDSQVPWFTVVDRIFHRDNKLSKEENFAAIMDTLFAGPVAMALNSTNDKVLRGCFHRYLDAEYLQHGLLSLPAEMSDWLFYYDHAATHSSVSSIYLSLAGAKFWLMFSDPSTNRFRNTESLIPNAKALDFETAETQKQNWAVVQQVVGQIPVSARVSLGASSAANQGHACELIPMLDKLLAPELVTKTKHGMAPLDAQKVSRVADLIARLDIKLETQRDLETNQRHLVYGPDWEGLTMYAGLCNIEQRKKALSAKRTWLFPLLHSELAARHTRPGPARLEGSQAALKRTPSAEAEKTSKRARLASSVEFFKNQYEDMPTQKAPAASREATRIWVKHHEGFSNAVRKNIGWADLWT